MMEYIIDLEEDFESKVMLEGGLNLRNLSEGKPLEISMETMDGDCNYEKYMRQEPEMYYNFDDLMKYVDLSVSESDSNLSPFEKMKLNMTDLTDGAGMVLKKVVKAGVGEVCPRDAFVKFHYSAFRENQEVPFDVSRLRQKFPESKQLGHGDLPFGLDLGIATMQKNEVAHFIIHYDYAYGPLGCGERIPPKTSILFKVELLEIERFKLPENEDPENPSQDEFNFQKLYEKAEKHVKEGTRLKKSDNNNNRAIGEYTKAIKILSKTPLNNSEEELKKRKLITKAYVNLTICLNAENRFRQVCNAYRDALYDGWELAENNTKLIFNFAEAKCGLHDFDYAARLYKRVLLLDPSLSDYVNKAMIKLAEKRRKSEEAERFMCRKMFQ